jgi:hypothetical protein
MSGERNCQQTVRNVLWEQEGAASTEREHTTTAALLLHDQYQNNFS